MSNKWDFPILPGGMSQGWNDAGISMFGGAPLSSVAREVTQNSADARPPGSDKPVHLHFDLVEVPIEEFPDAAGLRERIELCMEGADERARPFLDHALETMSRTKVRFLRMSDTNTKGMKGPCDEARTPYNAFMKMTGESSKEDEVAGGSYGIGKNAPFASSDLRTVFVSTVYEDENGQLTELAQGKAILRSHPVNGGNGNLAGAYGFYGEPDVCSPITSVKDIPAWLRRREQFGNDELGTSVFIAGFRSSDLWEELLLSAVIANYFSAIYEGDLEVSVGDRKVTSANLRKLLEDDRLMKAAQSEAKERPLKLARDLGKCLYHSGAREEEISLDILGTCRVRVLVKENLPSRVGILRNGMLVTHLLKGLKRFAGYSDFVAVVDLLDQDGNKFLRKMENPTHDNFEPDRLLTDDEQRIGRKALEELSEAVKAILKKHAQRNEGPRSSLDQMLARYFPDTDSGTPLPGSETEESDPEGDLKIRAKAPPRRKQPPFVEPDPGGPDGGSTRGKGGRRRRKGGFGSGGGSGSGQGGEGGRKKPAIVLNDVRSRPGKDNERSIWITPTESVTADVIVEIAGKDDFNKLEVESAQGSEISNGMIKSVKLEKNQRVELKVKLKEGFDGAVRVSAIKAEDV